MREVDTARIVIRAALVTEAGKLSSLAFRSKAHWGYSIEFMVACRRELTYSAEMVESPDFDFRIAEIAGEIEGFYALHRLDSERAELEALFVRPAMMGTGIGTALMAHCRDLARERGFREITIQGDPNAEAFYLAAGAVASGYRESASIVGRQLPMFTISL